MRWLAELTEKEPIPPIPKEYRMWTKGDPGVQGADCFTIQIPGNDRFYSWVNSSARCINVLRSRPVCRENVRQQYNEVTSFIDASNVYGSDEEHSSILRTYYDGRLQRNSISDQLPTIFVVSRACLRKFDLRVFCQVFNKIPKIVQNIKLISKNTQLVYQRLAGFIRGTSKNYVDKWR